MSHSFIQPIQNSDKALLQQSVIKYRNFSKNYEDSWGYIIQATRYLKLKWYDKKNNSLIFFGKKSETDPTLVVVNYFAEPAYLKNVIDIVQKKLNFKRTILKNVSPENVSLLTSYGFRQYSKNEYWDKAARFDDQTYPQQIIDLTVVLEKKGQKFKRLRNTLYKKNQLTIHKYTKKDKEEVLRLFVAKDSSASHPAQSKSGIYYESHAMYPDAFLEKFVIKSNTKEIIGFTAFSPITSKTCAFVATIFKPNNGMIGIWGIYQILVMIHEKGFQYVNFGGSEAEGTFNFVRRTFRPVEEVSKIHLIYP